MSAISFDAHIKILETVAPSWSATRVPPNLFVLHGAHLDAIVSDSTQFAIDAGIRGGE